MIELSKNEYIILKENFDDDLIDKIDQDNLLKIYNYLIEDGVYYAKDFILEYLDLFLLDYEEFKKKFEKLKNKLGENYIDLIGENFYLLSDLYLD